MKGQVYMKLLIAGGNMASNNVMQIRVMPPPATTAGNTARGPHLVRAKYDPGQAAAADSDGFVASITNIMEGLLGYAQGQGAQALGQVAALVKAVLGVGNPCGLSPDVISTYEKQAAAGICACSPSKWNLCPNAPLVPTQPWAGLHLSLPEAEIYTDYCAGNGVNGIMFVPQACPDGSEMRALQFVRTTCADDDDTNCKSANPVHTTCGDRALGAWNLDKCSDEDYYTPDTEIKGRGHVISDAPTANLYPGGSRYQKQFYDFLMCGTQIMDAFQWTRTGLPASQVQWCTPAKCPAGQDCKTTMAGDYSGLNRVSLDPKTGGNTQDLEKAVCSIENAKQVAGDPLLKAVQTYAGCGSAP